MNHESINIYYCLYTIPSIAKTQRCFLFGSNLLGNISVTESVSAILDLRYSILSIIKLKMLH